MRADGERNDAMETSSVDVVMEQASKAGAKIVKQAHDTVWDGYLGYLEDPDRHLWEVVWNPHHEIEE